MNLVTWVQVCLLPILINLTLPFSVVYPVHFILPLVLVGTGFFMCFILNPAPCSVNPILCLVGILVIDRLFGIFDFFILYDVHLIMSHNYFPRYSTVLIFRNNFKFSLGWCSWIYCSYLLIVPFSSCHCLCNVYLSNITLDRNHLFDMSLLHSLKNNTGF